jgi:hypothetical protein
LSGSADAGVPSWDRAPNRDEPGRTARLEVISFSTTHSSLPAAPALRRPVETADVRREPALTTSAPPTDRKPVAVQNRTTAESHPAGAGDLLSRTAEAAAAEPTRHRDADGHRSSSDRMLTGPDQGAEVAEPAGDGATESASFGPPLPSGPKPVEAHVTGIARSILQTLAEQLGHATRQSGLEPSTFARPVQDLHCVISTDDHGPLTLNLRIVDGAISVRLSSDRMDAVRELVAQRPSIDTALRAAGHTVEAIDIAALAAVPQVAASLPLRIEPSSRPSAGGVDTRGRRSGPQTPANDSASAMVTARPRSTEIEPDVVYL